MEFLSWHYTSGLTFYIKSWISSFDWTIHYFSIDVLVTSLFSPWKRLVVVDNQAGFSFSRYFETLTFNLISRFIGAAVRLILIAVGFIILVLTFFAGAIGILIWLVIPPIGYFAYDRFNRSIPAVIGRLKSDIAADKENIIRTILESDPGKFLLVHTGLSQDELIENARNLDNINLGVEQLESFKQLVELLVVKKVWSEEFLRKKGVASEDLILAAGWWDRYRSKSTSLEEHGYGRPGIGLELLYGYTPTLNQYSVDLSAPVSYAHRLIGRENVVNQMDRVLTGGNSIVLIGEPGVGKKTVVLEFAHRAANGQLGPTLAYRRILEFDYNFLLSESMDLNQKKTNLAQSLAEAAAAGNIILMFRDIQRLTNTDVEGYDFTDVFEEYMENKELKIIAVATPRDYERYISQNMRLRKFLKEVIVQAPSKKEALQILVEAASDWESKKPYTITMPALRKILNESDRYITEVPFPEKAIELLDNVILYKDQIGGDTITVGDANAVLAEKTGISFTNLTSREKKRLGNLEQIIHKNLIDQDAAVTLISKTLRAKTMGVTEDNKPVGSFLFLGPTGVGKTETAKVLAKVYYGSTKEILRFDMAEYSGSEGLERLIGSVSKNLPGVLTTAIKNKPASLLLLDEFEKVNRDVLNLFLSLLDEGFMTDAFGKKIVGRNLFIIATSNAGAEYIRQLVSSGVSGQELQTKVVNHVLENNIFSPEFINRFDGVVVYEPLRQIDLEKIARLQLEGLSETLTNKSIYLNVNDAIVKKLSFDGYDPAYGARPMKRIIDIEMGDMLGRGLITGQLNEGDIIEIVPLEGKANYGFKVVGKK
jgi:ATP-dependent Clp protease ATP-binding subunit ClpA